ncbi:MAG: DinB family protein [Gemmatimonadota bacterium]|nr:DinB family protein [Gemmatimonadota bacterium]
MSIAAALLPEFDHEMAGTRRALERVPDAALDWTPHPKSMSMRSLVTHLANLPGWIVETISRTELDMAPVDGEPWRAEPVASVAEAVAAFDRHVAAAREALAGASDAALLVNWTLLAADETIFSMPRAAVIRGFVLNHLVHHRGQLTVYLRLNDAPVPALYGPSADEEAAPGAETAQA